MPPPPTALRRPPWEQRKTTYLTHLRDMVAVDHPAVLVSMCDKLHNAAAIVADASDEHGPGDKVWEQFSASAAATAWYYRSLAETYRCANLPTRAVRTFDTTVAELCRLAEAASLRTEVGTP